MPSTDDSRRDGRANVPNGPPDGDSGELAAPRPGRGPDLDETWEDPLVRPGADHPHPDRRAHLDHSADAVGPLDVQAYLDARPSRRSGLSDRAEIRDYHRERARTRGHEALTPGADLLVTLLALARPHGEGQRMVPGHFATLSAEVLYSSSYSPTEKYVWAYLFDHRDYGTFRETGDVVVSTVRRPDLAACAAVCEGTIAKAIHGLMAKGRLTRRVRGQGRPPVYTLQLLESGASVYPTGHKRSARKRLLALLRRAAKNPAGTEAHLLAETLGLPLSDLRRRGLADVLFRRLARAAADARVHDEPPEGPCPHPVDDDDPDPQDL